MECHVFEGQDVGLLVYCTCRVGDGHWALSDMFTFWLCGRNAEKNQNSAGTPKQAAQSHLPQPAAPIAWIQGLCPAACRSPGSAQKLGPGGHPFPDPAPSGRAPAPSRGLRPAPRLPRPPGRRRLSCLRGAGGGRWPARLAADNAAAMSASQAGAAAAAAGPRARQGGLGFGLPPVPRKRADGQRGSSSGRDGGSGASLSSP